MVDTINPQTGQNDDFGNQNPVGSTNSAFAGFGKPDEIQVNLAHPTENSTPTELAPPVQVGPIVETKPVSQPNPNPNLSRPTSHGSYNIGSQEPLNWRLLSLVSIGCLVFVILVSTITFFVASGSNKGKLEREKAKLQDLNNQYSALQVPPDALSLPRIIEPPKSESTTPTPPKVEETPIQTPQTQPSQNQEGMG